MELVPSGARKLVGWYVPTRVNLSANQPAALKKAPPMKAPWYGTLRFSGVDYLIALDQPTPESQVLYLDANANGDLTDDPPMEWHFARTDRGLYYDTVLHLPLKTDQGAQVVTVQLYSYPDVPKPRLLCYPDYAYAGTVTLAGTPHDALLVDIGATGDFRPRAVEADEQPSVQLLLSADGTEKYNLHRGPSFDVTAPFKVEGKTWEVVGLDASGSFQIVHSDKAVPEPTPEAEPADPPTNVKPGDLALPFKATRMDGTAVIFPTDYQGKLVLLDFWATWCVPCLEEAPVLVRAYTAHRPEGLEILGVTFDHTGAESGIKKAVDKYGMTWPQLYDGKGGEGEVGKLYDIETLPSAFLVDGDSGRIVAGGKALRSDSLEATLHAELAKKAAAKKARAK